MEKIREVITGKEYFDDFFKEQSPKVREKIIKVLDIIEQIEWDSHYLFNLRATVPKFSCVVEIERK